MTDAALLNALPEPTLALELGVVVCANRAAAALFGVQTQDLEGRAFHSLFLDSRDRIVRYLDLWSSTAQMLPGSLSVRLGDGSVRRFRCSGARVGSDGGALLVRLTPAETAGRRFLALNERLTALGREARMVAAHQQWLEGLLNLMPTPMLHIELGTARVIFRNRAAIQMAIPREVMPLTRVATGERLEGLEITWHAAGLTRHALVHADVLPAMHGRAAMAVMTFQDVTRLKRVEEELQQAARLKDEFLATVSHELRTPLNAIMGWTMMLRDSVLDEAGRLRAVQSIEKNARAQARLVEDLLDVSRIITGQLRLDLRPTNIALAVEAAMDAVRPTASAKHVDLEATIGPEIEPVLADAERIQQIVWNLLSNAVKFTSTGGRVLVSTRRGPEGVEVAVSDTGAGISPEFLPRIFERFTQAESSGSGAHTGLGLGLAIARHLAELHGGTIEAYSAGPGEGATFTLRFPRLSTGTAEVIGIQTRRSPDY